MALDFSGGQNRKRFAPPDSNRSRLFPSNERRRFISDFPAGSDTSSVAGGIERKRLMETVGVYK
jgi:hypothetical protein